MLKYAFIINMPGYSPDSYSGTYENKESFSYLVGTDGMDQTEALVKNLVGEGYSLFNLCGDFDDDMTTQLKSVCGGAKITHSAYLPEEMAKLEKLDDLMEYGIIVVMYGVEETHKIYLKSADCNTTALFVKDLDAAKAAAKDMVADGICFIELCSWFDEAKTKAVIAAIEGAVPIGSCGL